MEDIINIINKRIEIIEHRGQEHLRLSSIQEDIFNPRYLKQLMSEENFLDELKKMIIKENKK